MISDKEKQIQNSLVNKEYRDALAVEHVNTTIAVQIRKMRESHDWDQGVLASQLGKHQETISQWENPDYGRYNITTLKALASAFDVALLVKFIPFSELVKDMLNLSKVRLSPPSYGEELLATLTPNPMEKPDVNIPIYADVNIRNMLAAQAAASATDFDYDEPTFRMPDAATRIIVNEKEEDLVYARRPTAAAC